MPFSARSVATRCATKTFVLGVVFLFLLLLATRLLSDDANKAPLSPSSWLLFTVALSLTISGFLALVEFLIIVKGFDVDRLTVTVHAGRVVISNWRRGEYVNVVLTECQWYNGRAWHVFVGKESSGMYLSYTWGFPPVKSIVLTFIHPETRHRWLFRTRNRVPLGYSDEARNVWHSFLELADVPKRP